MPPGRFKQLKMIEQSQKRNVQPNVNDATRTKLFYYLSKQYDGERSKHQAIEGLAFKNARNLLKASFLPFCTNLSQIFFLSAPAFW